MLKKSFVVSTQLSATLTGLMAATIYAALSSGILELTTGFAMLTILLIVFLIMEINYVRQTQPMRWLFNPPVLCSILTFFLYFGITNIIYFLPGKYIAVFGIKPGITLAMNKLMFLVIIGAIAMWLGYYSQIATKILNSDVLTRLTKYFFDHDEHVLNAWVIPILYLIANISRLLEVRFGIYGYSGNYRNFIAMDAYTEYLTIGDNLGILTLIVATLQYYSKNVYLKDKIYFFAILLGELFWGILSGMKSSVMIPFFCIFMIEYLRLGKISKKWYIIVPIVIIAAYSIIEPFRNEHNLNPDFAANSVGKIITLIVAGQERELNGNPQQINSDVEPVQSENNAPILLKFMSRVNLSYFGSLGITYADKIKTFPKGSPDFLFNTLVAPIGAFIPRFLWFNKPLQDIGLWYTHVVVGNPRSISSTAMGIFTNLYFTGGIFAIFIGLYFIGLIQKIIFFIIRPWMSQAGSLVYLALIPKFVAIAEETSQDIIVFAFRMLPLVLIFQALLYKHTRNNNEAESHN